MRAVWLRFILKCSSVYVPGLTCCLSAVFPYSSYVDRSRLRIAFDERLRGPTPELADFYVGIVLRSGLFTKLRNITYLASQENVMRNSSGPKTLINVGDAYIFSIIAISTRIESQF